MPDYGGSIIINIHDILGEQAPKPWRPIIVPLELRGATAMEHICAVGVVSVNNCGDILCMFLYMHTATVM